MNRSASNLTRPSNRLEPIILRREGIQRIPLDVHGLVSEVLGDPPALLVGAAEHGPRAFLHQDRRDVALLDDPRRSRSDDRVRAEPRRHEVGRVRDLRPEPEARGQRVGGGGVPAHGATPPEDGLAWVTDGEEGTAFTEPAGDLELARRHVLRFIDEDVVVGEAIGQESRQQIPSRHHPRPPHPVECQGNHPRMLDLVGRFVRHDGPLELADAADRAARPPRRPLVERLDRLGSVGLGRHAEAVRDHQTRGESVEGRDLDSSGDGLADRLGQALADLSRGVAREGECHDPLGLLPGLDQVDDPRDERPRLACARTGLDVDIPIARGGRGGLFGGEVVYGRHPCPITPSAWSISRHAQSGITKSYRA